MTVEFALLFIATYLVASLPLSNYLAKRFRGIDLRYAGAGNTGASNMINMTGYRLGLPVLIFDMAKGVVPVWIAHSLGLDLSRQIAVGLAAIIGHNWPVFLRFNGGRGVLTTLILSILIPLLNGYFPWEIIIFLIVVAVALAFTRNVPLAVTGGVALIPLVSWLSGKPVPMTLGFAAMFLLMVTRRLLTPRRCQGISNSELVINRLLFDREIRDREAWIRGEGIDGKDGCQLNATRKK